eukprot:jgi/Psemu1/297327/fgenesh1_pm.279_\
MVQGNWERRAEMSEARRLEAKQRKQRNADRKVFKSQAQDLLSFLNRNAVQLLRSQRHSQTSESERLDVMIHLWTDTQPCSEDASSSDGIWEEEHTTNKKRINKQNGGNGRNGRKDRSLSFENEDAARVPKSNKHTSKGKKKSHPRSKENSNECVAETSEIDPIYKPKLCRSHFFDGTCNESSNKKRSGGKKNYDCRFTHYSKKENTLNDILLPKTLQMLSASEKSYPASVMPGEKTPTAEAMDMVYYSSFTANELFGIDDSDDEQLSSTSISHTIVEAMAKQSCNIGSIVYFAIGDQLLYDRHRKGVLVEESQVIGLERLKSPTGKNRKAGDGIESMSLSASILEYILTFLNDRDVASMTSVCRSWNHEIGKQSENLWKYLLERRRWPVPTLTQGREQIGFSTLREAFVAHYTAVRDVNALKTGVDCLLTRKSMNEFDGAVRSFESFRNSPQGQNQCIAVKIWAQNSFLAAYAQDCTLRLFDSVEGSETSGERLCRELVCHCVDPHKKTKKRNCNLVAMALDTDFIGCLLHMTDDISEEEGFILSVLSRDDFLIDDGSSDETLQVIDIRQSVLNFLLSCDEIDHSLLQFHDFLSNDGDLDDIEVLVSQTLAECGYGRFMVEVSLAIPSDDVEDERINVLFRKLFLFSTSIGAITWMSDSGQISTPLLNVTHFPEEMTLSSVNIQDIGRYGYEIVSLSCLADPITILSIDSAGNFGHSALIQGTDLVRHDIQCDGWVVETPPKRPVAMLENQVVVADNLYHDELKRKKSVVSFYSRHNDDKSSVFDRLNLIGNLEVCHLIAIKNSHVIAICRNFEPDHEAIDGQWFGPDATTGTVVSSYAIVIDVASRSEIYRTRLIDDLGLHLGNSSFGNSSAGGEFPFHVAIQGDTVAAGLASKGVILTGLDARRSRSTDVRNQDDLVSPSKSAKKAKKKKIGKKIGKKDGFARGMKS